ncbi:MAG: hypothetical protein ACYCQJ_16245 [Nitrososphaerales archaeon]
MNNGFSPEQAVARENGVANDVNLAPINYNRSSFLPDQSVRNYSFLERMGAETSRYGGYQTSQSYTTANQGYNGVQNYANNVQNPNIQNYSSGIEGYNYPPNQGYPQNVSSFQTAQTNQGYPQNVSSFQTNQGYPQNVSSFQTAQTNQGYPQQNYMSHNQNYNQNLNNGQWYRYSGQSGQSSQNYNANQTYAIKNSSGCGCH